jgi:anti-anti-sigma factor
VRVLPAGYKRLAVDHALLDIEIERPAAGRAVVVFKGEHDLAQADAVREELSVLIAENELVVADFSGAKFVDSAMINVLLHAKREASGRQHWFRLQLGTKDVVQRVFDIAGVLLVIECAPTRAEALGEKSSAD